MLNFRTKLNVMLRKSVVMGGVVTAALVVSGCSQFRAHQGFIMDRTLTESIAPGVDNRESVAGTLGRPTFVGQYNNNDWYYFSRETRQLAFANPRPVEQQVLHVKFDAAGNVIAVNRTGLDAIAKLNPEGDKTPTRGRDRTIIQDIFGNIGAVNGAGAKGTGGEN